MHAPDYTLARAAIRDRMAPLLEPRRGFYPEINRELHRLREKDMVLHFRELEAAGHAITPAHYVAASHFVRDFYSHATGAAHA